MTTHWESETLLLKTRPSRSHTHLDRPSIICFLRRSKDLQKMPVTQSWIATLIRYLQEIYWSYLLSEMRDWGRITRGLFSSAVVPSYQSAIYSFGSFQLIVMLAIAAVHSTHPRPSPSLTSPGPLLGNGSGERLFHRTITKSSMHAYSFSPTVNHAQPCRGSNLEIRHTHELFFQTYQWTDES